MARAPDGRGLGGPDPKAAPSCWRCWRQPRILSQFFRASTSVIGPELIRDLALSPEALGFANGSFFVALLLAQVPVGVAFDRRRPARHGGGAVAC